MLLNFYDWWNLHGTGISQVVVPNSPFNLVQLLNENAGFEMIFSYTSDPSGSYSLTVEYPSSGTYLHGSSGLFYSGLNYIDRRIPLDEELGEYAILLDLSGWDPRGGSYIFRVHNESSGTGNIVVEHAENLFVTQEGQVQAGDQVGIYTADLQFTVFSGSGGVSGSNNYQVSWFLDAEPLGSGQVLNPTLQVISRDGTDLVPLTGMTLQPSSDDVHGAYYTVTTSDSSMMQTAGKNYVCVTTASIDGVSRSFSRILGRHLNSGE